MKKLEADIQIGKWQLGWRLVELFVMPYETGGWFSCCQDGIETQMHIGLNYDEFVEVVQVMQHEAVELAMAEEGCSFKRTDAFIKNASDTPVFVFNHNEFTEIAARSGFFMYHAIPAVEKWYKKTHPTRKRG